MFWTKEDNLIFEFLKKENELINEKNFQNLLIGHKIDNNRFYIFCQNNLNENQLDKIYIEYSHYRSIDIGTFNHNVDNFSKSSIEIKVFSLWRLLFQNQFFLAKIKILKYENELNRS